MLQENLVKIPAGDYVCNAVEEGFEVIGLGELPDELIAMNYSEAYIHFNQDNNEIIIGTSDIDDVIANGFSLESEINNGHCEISEGVCQVYNINEPSESVNVDMNARHVAFVIDGDQYKVYTKDNNS